MDGKEHKSSHTDWYQITTLLLNETFNSEERFEMKACSTCGHASKLTQEDKADRLLKLENAGITDYWKE